MPEQGGGRESKMKDCVRLGSKELMALLGMAILPKLFFSLLPDAVAAAGSAVWYAQIGAWLISIGFVCLLTHLMSLYPGQDLMEIFQSALGKFFGIILGLLFYLYFVVYTADLLGEAVQLIKVYNFPRTPFLIFSAGFLFVAWLISRYGLYGVAQTAVLFLAPVLIAIATALAIGSRQYDFRMLFPVGGYQPIRTGIGVGAGVSVYVDLILVMMLIRHTGDLKLMKRSVLKGMLWCGGAILLCSVGYLMTFGYRSSQGKTVGLVEIVQNVYFNQLFQRMESVFFLVMVMAAAVGVCIWFYLTVFLYGRIFKIQEERELMLPTLLMIFSLTTVSQLQTEGYGRAASYLFRYSGGALFVLCFFVWIVGVMRKKVLHHE